MLEYVARGITAALVAAYLLTAASACAVEDEPVYTPAEEIPAGAEDESARELSILSCLPEVSLALQQAAEAFAGGAGGSVTVQTVAEPSDYRSALMARLAAGEGPGLFQLYGAADLAALEGYLGDLGVLPWARGSLVEPLTVDGRVVGIPYAVRGSGFVVNRAVFEAAGLPLGDITGYESWRETFAALQTKIDGGELAEAFPDLVAVTTLPAQSDAYLGRYAADLLLSGAFASAEEALASPSLELPDAADVETLLAAMIELSPFRADWSGLSGVSESEMLENGIAAERIAAILSDTDIWKRILARSPDLELALLPVPLENREEAAVLVDAPAYWAVGADSGAGELAAAFLTWLYREEEGAAFFAERFGAASAYRDTAPDTGVTLHRALYDCIDRGLALPSLRAAAPERWREEVVPGELREYLTVYDKTWNDVIAACQDGWAVSRE